MAIRNYIQKEPGVTIDNLYEFLMNRAVKSTGLPREMLGHNPDVYMHYEEKCNFVINNLDKCVKMFKDAVKQGKEIYIYTDYDVDGIGAAVIMSLFCQSLGISAHIYIPDRYVDGYGLTSKYVDRIVDECKVKGKDALLLTFDNGISTIDEIAKAKDIGIDVLVLDHHEPKVDEQGNVVLPNADVVCDPHVTGGTCVDYCGAGLAYKFAQMYYKDAKLSPEMVEHMLDMMLVQAAVSTIADSVPLTGENYLMVEKGLTLMSLGRCTRGMKMMIEAPVKDVSRGCDLLGKNITATDVAFNLVPVLNAWGRLDGSGSRNIAQILSCNGGFSQKTSDKRNMAFEMNDKRKDLIKIEQAKVDAILDEDMEKLGSILFELLPESQKQEMKDAIERDDQEKIDKIFSDLVANDKTQVFNAGSIIVVYDPNCILGLCGLIAGYITGDRYIPCVCVTDDPNNPDIRKGSGRSIAEVNIKAILDIVKTYGVLHHHGGHPAACGLGIEKEHLEKFAEIAGSLIGTYERDNTAYFDVCCRPEDVPKAYTTISKFLTGVNLPPIVFLIDKVNVNEVRVMGKTGATIKLSQKNPTTMDTELAVLDFDGADKYAKMGDVKQIVVLGPLSVNVWKNSYTYQVLADDFVDERCVERGANGEILRSWEAGDVEQIQSKWEDPDLANEDREKLLQALDSIFGQSIGDETDIEHDRNE